MVLYKTSRIGEIGIKKENLLHRLKNDVLAYMSIISLCIER